MSYFCEAFRQMGSCFSISAFLLWSPSKATCTLHNSSRNCCSLAACAWCAHSSTDQWSRRWNPRCRVHPFHPFLKPPFRRVEGRPWLSPIAPCLHTPCDKSKSDEISQVVTKHWKSSGVIQVLNLEKRRHGVEINCCQSHPKITVILRWFLHFPTIYFLLSLRHLFQEIQVHSSFAAACKGSKTYELWNVPGIFCILHSMLLKLYNPKIFANVCEISPVQAWSEANSAALRCSNATVPCPLTKTSRAK